MCNDIGPSFPQISVYLDLLSSISVVTVVDPYPLSFAADVYYLPLNYTSLRENGIILNYTLMMRRSSELDSNFYSLGINILSTSVTERHFRLAGGALTAHADVVGPPLENLNTNVAVYRGTLHIVNVEEFILIPSGDLRINANLFFFSSQEEITTTDVLFNVIPPGK